MNNISKLIPGKIKETVDNAVIDYIESRKTFAQLIELTCPYNDQEVFSILNKSKFRGIINLVQKIGKIPYDDFKVPKDILKTIQDYYWKIRKFPDLSKLTAEEIKEVVDTAIIDYIEGRETIDDLARRIFPYDDTDAFFILDKSPYGELIGLLDRIDYEPYDEYAEPEMLQDTLQAYYNRLKGKKK